MEPQIQYVTTSDGVNIAYYAIGQGPATLFLTMPTSHLEAEWQIDPLRMGFIATAQQSTLVRLDPRGFGLSDRDPDDFALDSLVLDIEAVVDRLGLDKLRIFSYAIATMPALAYTARHPDKVTHLVQTPNAAASGEDMGSQRMEALGELVKVDYELGAETAMRSVNPEFSEQLARDFGRLLTASIDSTSVLHLIDEMKMWDLDEEASSMSTPTLLIHDRKSPDSDIAATRRVAGLIKGSRVAFVDNVFEGPLLAQRFFDEDVRESQQAAPTRSSRPSEPGGLRTILFTDLVGHTEMMSRLGDERGRDVLREHERLTREALTTYSGDEVKTMGDGFMASFGSVTKAVECAIALQRAFAERESGEPLSVRVGINAGEPIEEDGDLFGATVILASRIAAKAEGAEILVADTVRGLCSGKGFLFADRGEFVAKGFEDPVRLFEVRWRETD